MAELEARIATLTQERVKTERLATETVLRAPVRENALDQRRLFDAGDHLDPPTAARNAACGASTPSALRPVAAWRPAAGCTEREQMPPP